MLGLKSETSMQWVQQATRNLEEVLVDHAHCEKKAAVRPLFSVLFEQHI